MAVTRCGCPLAPQACAADTERDSQVRRRGDEAGEDGIPLQMMMFFQKRGFQPSMQSFRTTNKWQKHTFTIKDFDGCDGTDVTGLWIGTNKAGEFSFKIDHLVMEPK